MSSGGVTVGHLQPRFSEVAEIFAGQLAGGRDHGASLCAYRDGRPLLDLWGGWAQPGHPWRQDTLVPLTSITKPVLAAAVLALVQDNGSSLDMPVSAVWPEFGTAGKAAATIAHVLSHRVGLPVFRHAITLREQIERTGLTASLAVMAPLWPPGAAHGYHAITYGFLVTEVIGRMTGRTAAEIVHERVAGPLAATLSLGVPKCAVAGVARTVTPPDDVAVPACAATRNYAKALRDRTSLLHRATFSSTAMTFADMNDPAYFTAARPSAYGTAAGVVRLFAALIGSVDGVRVLSQRLLDQARIPRCDGTDAVFRVRTSYGLGFMLPGGPLMPPLPSGAFGHLGSTGALAFADPDRNLAFAYLPNRMKSIFEIPDRRASELVRALYQCL